MCPTESEARWPRSNLYSDQYFPLKTLSYLQACYDPVIKSMGNSGYFCKIRWLSAPERDFIFDLWTIQKLFLGFWEKDLSENWGQTPETLGGTLHLQPGQSNMCEGSVEDLQILVFSFYHRALGIRPRLPGRTVSTFIHWPYAMPPEGAPECSSICKTSPVFAVVANS